MKFTRKEIGAFLDLSIRIWTAFFVFIYGAGKAVQFKGAALLDIPMNEASPFQIMWAFFGATQAYPYTIGFLQIIGATMLVFQRTKLLGALLLTPIFLNIIFLDILYEIPAGALLNALVFQGVFLYIIIRERSQLVEAFHHLLLDKKTGQNKEKVAFFIAAAIFAAILFFVYTSALSR